jgi:hypothetical protein
MGRENIAEDFSYGREIFFDSENKLKVIGSVVE